MKKPSFFLLIVIMIMTILFAAACGGSGETPAPTNPPAPTTSSEGADAQEPSGSETGAETEPDETGEETVADGPALDDRGVPLDVPVSGAAYDLRVEANSTRIVYKVDGTIQEAVDFYVAEFPSYGWDQISGADSAVGAMGTLSRKNEAGDTLSILLSFNPNGNFVIVTIDIIRAP
jgi:hypothetical protein